MDKVLVQRLQTTKKFGDLAYHLTLLPNFNSGTSAINSSLVMM